MKIFNNKGMMIIPAPIKSNLSMKKQVLVVNECYCSNGHNLIDDRAKFDGYPGIVLKVKKDNTEGLIALSPVYGQKCRISIDIDLIEGETLQLYCPVCGENLPVFSSCSCGGDFIALFSTVENDYANCIGICNRVDCPHSVIQSEGKMMSVSLIENL